MPPGARFSGSASDVAKLIEPCITKVTWLAYGTSIDSVALLKHSLLIVQLKKLQPNLSFSAKLVRAGFGQLLESSSTLQAFKWQAGEAEDWTLSMTVRLRTMLRHAQQGLVKEHNNEWCKRIRVLLDDQGGGDGDIANQDEGEGDGHIDNEDDGDVDNEG